MTTSRPSGTPVLRRLNTAVVLDAVRRAHPRLERISDLVKTTGLTRPTVAQAVADLIGQGLLRSAAPPQERELGRPAVRVRLNERTSPTVGIDLGVHSVAVAIADLAGERLALVRQVVASGGGAGIDAMLTTLDQAIAQALRSAGIPSSALVGVTVGSPGIVDRDQERITLANAQGQMSTIDLLTRLRPRFTCPIRLENNANLVASAVYAAQEVPAATLLAVQWGERLGAGIVIDGQLHRGASSAAGEIGYVSPGASPARIGMDEQGPLEVSIGTAGIVARARVAVARDPSSVLNGRLDEASVAADAAAVFEAAATGDTTAVAVVDEVARVFASAIAPIVLALNPDSLVIGGGIARAGDQLARSIQRHLDDLTLHSPRVELSTLAQDAVVTGALRVAHDDLWERLLTTEEARSAADEVTHRPRTTELVHSR